MFTADIDLAGTAYSNPENFYVTFEVTTIFELEDEPVRKEQGTESGDRDEDIDVYLDGFGGLGEEFTKKKTSLKVETTVQGSTLQATVREHLLYLKQRPRFTQ